MGKALDRTVSSKASGDCSGPTSRTAKARTQSAAKHKTTTTTRVPVQKRVYLEDGRRITYRDWPGRGRPMVLLHGMLDDSAGWDALAKASRRPVIAIDLPGFGRSDKVKDPSLGGYANDVKQTLDRLGYDDFILVGHSLGGGTAATLANMIPEKVNRLLLIAPVGFGKNPLAELAQVPGIKNLVKIGMPFAVHNPAVVTAAYMGAVANGKLPDFGLIKRIVTNSHSDSAVDAITAIAKADDGDSALFKRAGAYKGPVTALWGDGDRLVPVAHNKGLKAAFPQARIDIWKGMGHHPQNERPGHLAQFVETIGSVRVRKDAARKQAQSVKVKVDGELQPLAPEPTTDHPK